MSQIVDTSVGRFRCVTDREGNTWFLWECPRCKQWATLSGAQWAGLISVACDCGYHETHEFDKILAATVVAARLTGSPLSHDEGAGI